MLLVKSDNIIQMGPQKNCPKFHMFIGKTTGFGVPHGPHDWIKKVNIQLPNLNHEVVGSHSGVFTRSLSSAAFELAKLFNTDMQNCMCLYVFSMRKLHVGCSGLETELQKHSLWQKWKAMHGWMGNGSKKYWDQKNILWRSKKYYQDQTNYFQS
jgi:hypothetical protein